MRQRFLLAAALSCLAGAVAPTIGFAQPIDQLGDRAAAIGAFVAVADDASAVAWNPAALINGPLFNILLDAGQSTSQEDFAVAQRPAGRAGGTFLAVATLPLGISYYRGRLTELSPAAQPSVGRQERQVSVRTLALSHVGVTVLQSITEAITVGATAKLVRGNFASGSGAIRSWDEGFDRADNLPADGRTTADVDVGVITGFGRFRAGLVARNLAAPAFTSGDDRLELARHVRIGGAWGDRWPGISRLIVAIDADLTRVDYVGDERRDVAAGAERWFGGQRFAVRGGVRASTIGGARPVVSGGASVAVRRGVFVDAYAAKGRDQNRRWGIAGRLSY